MFWKKVRKLYGGLNSEDQDIKKYLQIASEIQEEGYKGLVGWIQDMGHRWVSKRTAFGQVLEIGFGRGRHSLFFKGRREDYFVSDYLGQHVRSEQWMAVRGHGVLCNTRELPFKNETFRQVLSLYNLEHTKDLQNVLAEIHRVLKRGGEILVSLPCEGGLFWNVGRELTTRRKFSKKYGINYDKIIAYEHVWDFPGVLQEIRNSRLFNVECIQMLPLHIPSYHINLIACFKCSVVK